MTHALEGREREYCADDRKSGKLTVASRERFVMRAPLSPSVVVSTATARLISTFLLLRIESLSSRAGVAGQVL